VTQSFLALRKHGEDVYGKHELHGKVSMASEMSANRMLHIASKATTTSMITRKKHSKTANLYQAAIFGAE